MAICTHCGLTVVEGDVHYNDSCSVKLANGGVRVIESRGPSNRELTQIQAAAELQKRMDERKDAKLHRDRKLREEWLGREFELFMRDELFGMEALRVRFERYNPDTSIVHVRPLWFLSHGVGGEHQYNTEHMPLIPWTTDQFWGMLEAGTLKPV